MFLSKLELYNFRQFHSIDENPAFSVSFHKGLNALIGENDAGKTAIIDAIKIVLLTQSNEFIRVTDEDFYTDINGHSETEIKISIVLSELSLEEAKNFIEYLSISTDTSAGFYMQLHFRAWKEKNRIFTELRAGNPENGIALDSKARELLKVVYLKPLRDAEREMRSGRNSRISQILINHPLFEDGEKNKLVSILSDANENIKKYFTEEEGEKILANICTTLNSFSDKWNPVKAKIATSDLKLKGILESLSLLSTDIKPGLGQSNLLFMAAELLLLKQDEIGGLKLALVEELEAHLHPQAQLRLIEYLQKEYQDEGVQIIISTHSTVLASKINLKNIILIKNKAGYDLSPGHTQLLQGDYLFLQRFLDVTKANMFFAKGIIMVEGDAESLLIPLIADVIGYPLEKYGISLVNVGGTAFLRYSKIFARRSGKINLPVAIITDSDVKPETNDLPETLEAKARDTINEKKDKYETGNVKAFITPYWTLEYTLALSGLNGEFHKAIHCAKKIKNSDKYPLNDSKMNEVDLAIQKDNEIWRSENECARAWAMFELMKESNGKSGLKAITAQCLVALLQYDLVSNKENLSQPEAMFSLDMLECTIDQLKKKKLKKRILEDKYLKYIVNAIIYAAGETEEVASD